MAACNAVQQKIPCVFVTGVHNEPSLKHAHQNFRVTASDVLNPEMIPEEIVDALATEKVDGTCCLIQEFQGVPWLWARFDRKPNKAGDRKFKRYQAQVTAGKQAGDSDEQPSFQWDYNKDFKAVPDTWIPASGIVVVNSIPQADSLGHTPGWVPLEKNSRQYLWHLTAVDLNSGLGLVLSSKSEDSKDLVIKCVPLSKLCGKTCELIGTNVNGNPYGLGTKQQPLHLLVVHGSLPISCPSPLNSQELLQWFRTEDESGSNKVEGVVWHCHSGSLYKLHRHHLNLCWPLEKPALSLRPATICVNSAEFGISMEVKSQFSHLSAVNGHRVEQLLQLNSLLSEGQ